VRIWDVYPGSEFFSFPDPHSKNLSIFTQHIISKHPEIPSGLFIPDPDPDFFNPSRISDPGVKKAPDLGSGSATLVSYHEPLFPSFFFFRSWSGLEQDLGGTAVQPVKLGRSGLAAGYSGEPGMPE
jgi:hypothetical protein